MKVRNRDGESVAISYDEIKHRILRLWDDGATDGVDIDTVVIHTVNGIYDGITTSELDELSARVCAGMQAVHFGYDALSARILASNAAKNVRRVLLAAGHPSPTFSAKVAFIDSRLPGVYDASFVAFVRENAAALDDMLCYERDALHSYFALRTLERSYLMRVDDVCVESAQDMWMRVAIAVSRRASKDAAIGGGMDAVAPSICEEDTRHELARIKACYDGMSNGDFTHATPTLFNAGMCVQQCSSCYLLGTDDSLAGIFKTISDAAKISKWAGGIGVHVSNVRAKGSRIKSTNGVSDGIVPMLKVSL
jgi:ribonucleoside-diphosphate reductase alpha chain